MSTVCIMSNLEDEDRGGKISLAPCIISSTHSLIGNVCTRISVLKWKSLIYDQPLISRQTNNCKHLSRQKRNYQFGEFGD